MRKIDSALTLVHVDDEQAWAELLETRGRATVFHEWKWLDMIADAIGHTFIPLAVVREGVRVGAVPVLLRHRGPFGVANWLPFPYVGPLVEDDDVSGCLAALRRWQKTHRVVLQQASFAPNASPPLGAFRGTGFKPLLDGTLVVEASSVEEAWSGLETTARRRIQRSSESGVLVESADVDAVEMLSGLIDAAYARRDLPSPYRRDVGKLIWETYGGDARARLAVARLDGRVAGLHVTILRGRIAYLWHAGVAESARRSGAGYALYWDAIVWSIGCGARLDLVGVPDESIRKFKQQFGPVPVPYLVARRAIAGWMAAQAVHRKLSRGLRRR